jgi:hypothetical protein
MILDAQVLVANTTAAVVVTVGFEVVATLDISPAGAAASEVRAILRA